MSPRRKVATPPPHHTRGPDPKAWKVGRYRSVSVASALLLALTFGATGRPQADPIAAPSAAAPATSGSPTSAPPSAALASVALAPTAEAVAAIPASVASAAALPTRAALTRLARWVHEHQGQLSVHALNLQSGATLLALEPDRAINPASNMKLVTAAVALDRLGPNFRFQTGVYGRVTGERIDRLVLRGQGDPSLLESDVWRLANAISNLGVIEVGELLVDQSAFDDQFLPPGFEQQPEEWAPFRAPISAIALERNTVTLNVLPTTAGSPARVWFEPRGLVTPSGNVATRPRGSGQDIRLTLTPSSPGLSATLSGHVAQGLPRQRFPKRVEDPRLLPGLNLAASLERLGVRVAAVRLGGSDETQRLTYTESAPLSHLLAELGKHSDNFTAEMIFKSLGTPANAAPRTTADAVAVVEGWLAGLGPLPPGTRIVNGSGLFDTNRLSASTLTRLLARAHSDPRLATEFASHLSIGGVDGTLRSRFASLRERRALCAKTGTLRDVVALSGYLQVNARETLAFSILVNGIEDHAALRPLVDTVVIELGNSDGK